MKIFECDCHEEFQKQQLREALLEKQDDLGGTLDHGYEMLTEIESLMHQKPPDKKRHESESGGTGQDRKKREAKSEGILTRRRFVTVGRRDGDVVDSG